MKKMKQVRYDHRSCQLEGQIYVSCGIYISGNGIISEEKPLIDAYQKIQAWKRWDLISERNLIALWLLSGHFSIALNGDEIIIYGGETYREPNIQPYDTWTDHVQALPSMMFLASRNAATTK